MHDSQQIMVSKEIYKEYLNALLAGDRKTCLTVVQALLNSGIEIRLIYEDLFKQSMYEVGELWEANKISVAVEHLATAITENCLNLVYPYLFSETKIEKKAVVTCAPGEFHQIGARMVADFFELNSWNSYFLGSSTPTSELKRYISDVKPDIVIISISIAFNIHNLNLLVKEISDSFPEIKIIIGGQAFRWGGEDAFNSYKNVEVITDLTQLYEKHIKDRN